MTSLLRIMHILEDTVLDEMREDLPDLRRGSASEPNTDLSVPEKAVKREVRRCHEQVTGINEQAFRVHRSVGCAVDAFSVM